MTGNRKLTCIGCLHYSEVRFIGIVIYCKLFRKPVGEDTPISYRKPVPLTDKCWTPAEQGMGIEEVNN